MEYNVNTQIGKQMIKAVKPRSPLEMSAANALIRLAAPEGQERPSDRYIRFKNNIDLWYEEMDKAGLTKEEQKILEPYYLKDYGVPASQEALMLMVMDKNISNFTLAESNNARRTVAKKKLKEIPALKEKFISQCPSKALGEYCWTTMMMPQMTYSFSIIHANAYSFVAIQSLVLCVLFPSIYWDCACLIVNSGGAELSEEDMELIKMEEENDFDGEDEETSKKKQKAKPYGKIAKAIGEMKSNNIAVSPPDINKSAFTFSPDVKENLIRYGLGGIVKIGNDKVYEIIRNRPYSSLNDFIEKVKLNKTQIINLIKSGAFDSFGEREEVLKQYIEIVSGTKQKITMQNMRLLLEYNLIPERFNKEIKIYNFNKFIKSKENKFGDYLYLDDYCFSFYESNDFPIDLVIMKDEKYLIPAKEWDKIYKKAITPMSDYVKKNNLDLLSIVNNELISENWNKYCEGSISKWEMDSISFYAHEHELSKVINKDDHSISDYDKLPDEPLVDYFFTTKQGNMVPMYKIVRIMGTVLDKDKTRKTVTILTPDGSVVDAKVWGTFAYYDKQLSEIDENSKKKVIRKSDFSRGNKIILTGIKKPDNIFICKKYKNTPWHTVEKIETIDKYGYITTSNRGDEE